MKIIQENRKSTKRPLIGSTTKQAFSDLDDAFKAGARYADEHLSQENKNKMFEATKKWLYEHDNCGWIDEVEVTVFLENFKKEVIDKL